MIDRILNKPHSSMTSKFPSTIPSCTIVRKAVLKRYMLKYYRLGEVLGSFSFDDTFTCAHTHKYTHTHTHTHTHTNTYPSALLIRQARVTEALITRFI